MNKATTNLELHFYNNCFGDEFSDGKNALNVALLCTPPKRKANKDRACAQCSVLKPVAALIIQVRGCMGLGGAIS